MRQRTKKLLKEVEETNAVASSIVVLASKEQKAAAMPHLKPGASKGVGGRAKRPHSRKSVA